MVCVSRAYSDLKTGVDLISPLLIDSSNCRRAGSLAPGGVIRHIAKYGLQGIELDKSFGFAPSTLVHQSKEASLGKAKI